MGCVSDRALARAEPQGLPELCRGVSCGLADRADAASLLAAVAANPNAPAFARASALAELGPHLDPSTITLARAGLSDPDPLIRIGALDMLSGVPANQLWLAVAPLLSDSSRGARIRAAELLRFRARASRLPTVRGSIKLWPSSSPHNASIPTGLRRGRRSETFTRSAVLLPRRKQNTARRYASVRNLRPRQSISPTSIGSLGGTARERTRCVQRSRYLRRMREGAMPWGSSSFV
jgi:hypothetical protein